MMRYCFVILISVLLLASCIKQQPKKQAVKAPAPDTLPKVAETIEPPEPEVLDLTKEDSFVHDLERSTLAIFERHKNDKYFEYQDSAVRFDRYIKIGNLFGDSIRYALVYWNPKTYYEGDSVHNILLKAENDGWKTILNIKNSNGVYFGITQYVPPPTILDFNNDGVKDFIINCVPPCCMKWNIQWNIYTYNRDSFNFSLVSEFANIVNPTLDRKTGRVYGSERRGWEETRTVHYWQNPHSLIPLAKCSVNYEKLGPIVVEQKYQTKQWQVVDSSLRNDEYANKRLSAYFNPSRTPIKLFDN